MQMQSHINVGSGNDIAINELASMISKVVGYDGDILFDESMPDGSPRKLMNVSLLNSLGWKQEIDLVEGLEKTYEWFIENQGNFRTV